MVKLAKLVYDIVFKEHSDSEPIRRLKSLRKTSSSKNRNEINKHIEFLDYDKKLEKRSSNMQIKSLVVMHCSKTMSLQEQIRLS